jgi:hypothetical protein
MTGLNRRALMCSGLAMLTSASGETAAQTPPGLSAEEIEFFEDEKEPLPEWMGAPTTRTKLVPYWSQEDAQKRLLVEWATDADSYDYAHLQGLPFDGSAFEITAQTFLRYMELCSYEFDTGAPKLLFGLRGCQLDNSANAAPFKSKHQVREVVPDHVHFRCLMGVLDRQRGELALFTASTVPVVDLMAEMIKRKSGCNMMPTGLHRYSVGPHKGIKQPGAFRQQQGLWVRRTTESLLYSTRRRGNQWDDLDGNLPYNNIHSASFAPNRSTAPFFSSAGCQVVKGSYTENKVPVGPWAEFRTSAGLSPRPTVSPGGATEDDGKKFDYVLATGREMRALAVGKDPLVVSLRLGSQGTKVAALQKQLSSVGGAKTWKDGEIDRKTMEAIIRWQIKEKLPATAILNQLDAKKLGLIL